MRRCACLGIPVICVSAIALLILIAFVKNAAQTPPANVALETNIVYGTGGKQ